MIEIVYAGCSVVNEKLIRQMLGATDHPAAFAAFASIVFAPRAHTDFGQNLIRYPRTPALTELIDFVIAIGFLLCKLPFPLQFVFS
jgi:hypothetical protein